MKSAPKRAAAYIRASTDMQQAVSPESQLEKIKEYAEKNDYLLPPQLIYMESEGVSGRSTARRDAFNRMIAEAKRKPAPFDAVLVCKFSRFARNQEESV
ncbi:MAG: recombinase family protein, partial [Clostridiaceae bacterium]|nr:recombinase family protein [Clostridiaceae bacterium]